MSQDYKLKFEQMQESFSGSNDSENDELHYQDAGNARNICFVISPNRKLRSFNYAYLVSLEYDPQASAIIIEFTTHTITIKGYSLLDLYFELFDQRNRILDYVDTRYQSLEDGERTITEIILTKNNDR